MHSWHDDWPHWNELYEAEQYISGFVYRWSRCRLMSKEKWGTLRYEWIWPPGAGYHCRGNIKMPFFSKKIITIQGKRIEATRYLFVWTQSWPYRLWSRWGYKVFKIAIKRACKKFPNVQQEILADFNWRGK